jgi:hypothetical protein
MDSELKKAYDFYKLYEALRGDLMESLQDEDLRFSLGGETLSLGELCVEIGEIQVAYIQSFRTFTQNFDYRIDQDGLAESCVALNTWFAQLDHDLEAVLAGLSAEDVANRKIDRGHNFQVSPRIQLEIYKEALLIFYGKVSVYLKAKGHTRPQSWVDWIG